MQWIATRIKWIMIVSGALTCTMFYAAIAPQAALQGTFGETLDGAAANIVVRNWGVLIGLMGGMLVYGASHPVVRPLVLIVAGISKVAFIALVLSVGRQFLSYQAGIAVVSDVIQVSLFVGYLASAKKGTASERRDPMRV